VEVAAILVPTTLFPGLKIANRVEVRFYMTQGTGNFLRKTRVYVISREILRVLFKLGPEKFYVKSRVTVYRVMLNRELRYIELRYIESKIT
jgi:hypothetical protein